MLSDRPYMRGTYDREKTSVLTWIVSAIVAGSLVQLILGSSWIGAGAHIDAFIGLSVGSLHKGWLWTLLTHAFLHSKEFILHGIFNVLALYFLGRELQPMLGARRFLGVFVAATVIGGLAWSAVHWGDGPAQMHLGASAAIFAFFTIFACFFPNQQITFLLFFVFPVTLKPKHVAYFLLGFSVLGLVSYEITNAALPFDLQLASSAHLGGILAGFLYYRFVHDSRWSLNSARRDEMELPRWLKRTRKTSTTTSAYQASIEPAPIPEKENIRAEVDRILDKINSEGFGALTGEEKRVLDNAKQLLSGR